MIFIVCGPMKLRFPLHGPKSKKHRLASWNQKRKTTSELTSQDLLMLTHLAAPGGRACLTNNILIGKLCPSSLVSLNQPIGLQDMAETSLSPTKEISFEQLARARKSTQAVSDFLEKQLL